MLTSSISGKRLIPFYHSDFEQPVRASEAFVFGKLPGFEVIHETSESSSEYVVINARTSASQTLTLADSTFTHKGVEFKINAFAETAIATGDYYYRLKIGDQIFKSAVFRIEPCQSMFRIEYSDDCDDFHLGSKDFVNVLNLPSFYMEPSSFEEFKNGIEDGEGREISTYVNKRAIYSAQIIGNSALYERLEYIRLYGSIKLKTPTGREYLIDRELVTIDPSDINFQEFSIKINFGLIELVEDKDCHFSVFDVPEGDGSGDSGDPGAGTEPIDCASISISINASAFPVLSYDIANPVEGVAPVVQWTRNGVFISSSDSINATTESALYEVSLQYENCELKHASFEYLNPCSAFAVKNARLTGSLIDADIEGNESSDSISISIEKPLGNSISTNLPFDTEGDAGVYFIVATNNSKGCSARTSIAVSNQSSEGCTLFRRWRTRQSTQHHCSNGFKYMKTGPKLWFQICRITRRQKRRIIVLMSQSTGVKLQVILNCVS